MKDKINTNNFSDNPLSTKLFQIDEALKVGVVNGTFNYDLKIPIKKTFLEW